MRDYCGSLVNAITAYAFLQEIAAEGHRGIIVTAGNAATGQALASLARRRNMPAIFLVRSLAAQDSLQRRGIEHVIVTADDNFERRLGGLAAELQATAVFDGVGGDLTSHIAPSLPPNSTIYIYGLLGGAAPVSFPSTLFQTNNLVVKRFSNFESQTVKNLANLTAALKELEGLIDEPMFKTRIGKEFAFDQISEAMNYESTSGAKAVLLA
ncbi:zinc-binding dehydrogenase, partial [Burkholderia gladioli]